MFVIRTLTRPVFFFFFWAGVDKTLRFVSKQLLFNYRPSEDYTELKESQLTVLLLGTDGGCGPNVAKCLIF